MKLKLLSSVLALSVSYNALANEHAKNYNGWTLGVDGGWVGSSLKFNNNTVGYSTNLKNFNQTSFGVHTDWNKTSTNHIFYGFGLGAGYHAGNPSKSIGTVKIRNKTYSSSDVRQKRDFYAELVGRLGWNFNNAVLYALTAVKTTYIEHKLENPNTNFSYSDKKYFWAIGPGAGFDFKINRNWSFGAEYRYMFEESTSFTLPSGSNISLNKLRSHNVLGRLSYHF